MKNTNIKLRNLIIYQIYVRNFSTEGTLNAIVSELDRIKDLGVDVVYLLPVHPIGVKGKKGSLGCPYSIQDYRAIAEELGTMEDFQNLINEVHARGMQLMMDIVYNHTSKDSVLLQKHPEYFFRNEAGELSGKVGEWSDVTDFDYSKDKALWIELSDTLVEYAKMGVDGFRCDVASMVPMDFWKFARKNVNKVNRKLFWLSESIHGNFCKHTRDMRFDCMSESEVYQVFDMAYDYDIQPYFDQYLRGTRPLKDYLEGIQRQEEIYPGNYVKMKNLENHDNVRIAKYVDQDMDKISNWTAFNYFQKGCVLLYAGEEYCSTITPSLFDVDPYDKNEDISELLVKLAKLKKQIIFAKGIFHFYIPELDGVAYNTVEDDNKIYHGIFNVGQAKGQIKVKLADGSYRNYLTGKNVKVKDGNLDLVRDPIIIRVKK
ncbi:MAG: alpha-amylase [Bacilli bacterium]|nr:alpha-amylase [Bacilli bacterium]